MPLNAIITAGGPLPRSLEGHTGVSRKALVQVGGRLLLHSAVEAARGCEQIDRVVTVGNRDVEAALAGAAEFVMEGPDLVANIQRGFDHCGGARADYVVLSPDLPFITAGILGRYTAAARDSCELAAPLVSRQDFLGRFPHAPNKFARFAGGLEATMGSCFYFSGPALRANLPLARDCYRYRRYPHRLAIMLGLPIVLAYLFRRLSIEALERRAAQLTGVAVRALPTRDAELAYDIDDLVSVEYAERLLAGELRDSGS